jgi:hypothetical protein
MKAVDIKAENKELFEAVELFARLKQIFTHAELDVESFTEGVTLVNLRIDTNLNYMDNEDTVD